MGADFGADMQAVDSALGIWIVAGRDPPDGVRRAARVTGPPPDAAGRSR